MTLDVNGIVDAVVSHALATGLFEQVNGHEPKNAPSAGGLTAAVWVDKLGTVQSSGLGSASGRLVLNVRIYTSMLTEPLDAIDPNLTAAVDTLMRAYNADFTLGGLVRQVDVYGADGEPLAAQAGYIDQDGGTYRVFTISLPVTVNDLWDQA